MFRKNKTCLNSMRMETSTSSGSQNNSFSRRQYILLRYHIGPTESKLTHPRLMPFSHLTLLILCYAPLEPVMTMMIDLRAVGTVRKIVSIHSDLKAKMHGDLKAKRYDSYLQ